MTNPVIKFLGKVWHVLDWPFVHAAQVIGVLTVTLTQFPLVRQALIGLVQQIQINVQDIATAAASEGVNIPADLAELNAAKNLWTYVTQTFLPAIAAAYKSEEAAALTGSTTAAVKKSAAKKTSTPATVTTDTPAAAATEPGSTEQATA
jgi:hypothetical protein